MNRMQQQVRAIRQALCEEFDISESGLLSRCRTQRIAGARMLGYFVLRVGTDMSSTEIAEAFERSDHSTVLYGLASHMEKMSAYKSTQFPCYDRVVTRYREILGTLPPEIQCLAQEWRSKYEALVRTVESVAKTLDKVLFDLRSSL